MPRDIYERYWSDMEKLLRLPGAAFRRTVEDAVTVPDVVMAMADGNSQAKGIAPSSLAGVVVDDADAIKSKRWRPAFALPGFVGTGYVYARESDAATIRFPMKAPASGRFEIRIAYQAHPNRGSEVPVTVEYGDQSAMTTVNMKLPPQEDGFHSIGQYALSKDDPIVVQFSSEGAGGDVHADAVQMLPAKQALDVI